MTKPYKWRVTEKPSGPFGSMQHRNWPYAEYGQTERIAAMIGCLDSYSAPTAKSKDHAPLTVHIADHAQTPRQWRKMKRTFATLDEAKKAAEAFLAAHPELAPKA